jgi:hypothetical protein
MCGLSNSAENAASFRLMQSFNEMVMGVLDIRLIHNA